MDSTQASAAPPEASACSASAASSALREARMAAADLRSAERAEACFFTPATAFSMAFSDCEMSSRKARALRRGRGGA